MFKRKSPKIDGTDAISELNKVTIGGIEQWVYIRGQNKSKPILLMLHGGPGTGQIGFVREFQTVLEQYFVIVQWDQRGAGLSYSKNIPLQSMNIQQFVCDTIEVTKYILNRLNREQLYLIGHSWGTILGLLAIKEAPQLYKRYFGVSQVAYVKLNELISYEKLLEKAQKVDNTKAYAALHHIGPPPWDNLRHNRIHQKYIEAFGGGISHDRKMLRKIMLHLLMSKEYTWRDCIRFFQGQYFSMKHLQTEMMQINLMVNINEVTIPIYFMMGKHDLTTPYELSEQLFSKLKAPEKQWIMFENSAHSPLWEEPDKFIEIILKETAKD